MISDSFRVRSYGKRHAKVVVSSMEIVSQQSVNARQSCLHLAEVLNQIVDEWMMGEGQFKREKVTR